MPDAIAYLDFDLLIRQADGRYRAQVLSSPQGEASADFAAPFTDLELQNFILRLGRPRRGTRRIGSPEMEAARDLGGRLYDAVFCGGVRDCWGASMRAAEDQNRGLRLRLRIADAPELNDIPWEYLYNSSPGRFLSLSEYTPLVRYIDLPERIRPLAVDGPLAILVMISSPADLGYPSLNVEDEWTRLNSALGQLTDSGQVRLVRLSQPTLSALQRELRRGPYHILHFIGHGGFDRRTQGGVLVLPDRAGRAQLVAADHLAAIVLDHRSLRLVVLNACEGSRSSREDPFSGVAQTLVKQGSIPAVIAMQFEITDAAAIKFAEEFYSATADGYPVDAALAAARKAIFAEGNDIEWGTPVLYLRAPDGRLFSINREAAQRAEAPRLAEEEKRKAEEAARLAEEKRKADEAARLAEEKRKAQEAASLADAVRSDFTVFRDAPFAPELVVVPAGEFMMGSPVSEEGRFVAGLIVAGPQHRVTIGRRFAIGRYPVTFDEYNRFCEAKGQKSPEDEGWGRGRRPAINVSRDDAQAYIAWLSQETGRAYRLPSEAEWEFACRAGTTTLYSIGDAIAPDKANYVVSRLARTSEVGAYPANPWGLHDMHGNVWEWVEDDWHINYQGAPSDGSAWKDAGRGRDLCISRGGSWKVVSRLCRSARRNWNDAGSRLSDIGFRVARTLS